MLLDDESIKEWEWTALRDLSSSDGRFRDFLWRYGNDQRRGRQRYQFLAEIYNETRRPADLEVLSRAGQVLPDPADGKVLKTDLISRRPFDSLVTEADPITVVDFFSRKVESTAFPAPEKDVFDAIAAVWPSKSSFVVSLVEAAVSNEATIGERLLETLSSLIDAENFSQVTSNAPLTRAALLSRRPELLDSSNVSALSIKDLSDAIARINAPELAARVIPQLLSIELPEAALVLSSKFPALVVHSVLNLIASSSSAKALEIGESWISVVKDMAVVDVLSMVRTGHEISAYAFVLDYDLSYAIAAGSHAWAHAVENISDGFPEISRSSLMSLLMAIALSQPSPGCEPLFLISFETVHSDMERSALPTKAFENLSALLPWVHWWRQWDLCYRLRLAVVSRFVENRLSVKAFSGLSSDRRLCLELREIAAETKKGKSYLRKLERY
ncbi:hypothetical protein [Xanthomonas sp. 3307]|uniref:hypothetical protein n=1 Tax=Xanthomonas sp. 3307 TaxID=3035316 RepID=UPI001622EC47|nr:hypothetical protein [Xanthomonas sp. 3307]MBB5942852.1 hypothetical protein [Xanthomonas sp. 3307]